jgi:hypothetical protein
MPAQQITTTAIQRAAVVSVYAKARTPQPDILANVIIYQSLVATKPFIARPDYAQPVKARGAQDTGQASLLIELLPPSNTTPIVLADWTTVRRPLTAQDTGQLNLLPYLLAPIPLPAMPPDLTQRRSSKGVSTQDTQQANGLIVLNAPTLLPFFAVDLTPNLRPRAPQTQDTAQRNLLTFLLAPVPLPFIGVDLGQPRVGARPQDTGIQNVVIYQALTFPVANNAWVIFPAPRRAVTVDAIPNLLTSTLTAQASPPFALRDWAVVPRRVTPQDTQRANDLVVLRAPNPLPILAVDLTPSLRAKAPQTQDTGQRNLLLYLLVPSVTIVGDPRFEVVLPAVDYTVSVLQINYVVNVGDDDNA